MLSLLRIQNFALIDQLELSFGKGLNVLTGETGAGKSIVLDAIDIVLGGKVTNRLIRQGSRQASIEATFQTNIALQKLEAAYRDAESSTRIAYHTVLTQIGQVNALQQSVKSSTVALKATQAAFGGQILYRHQ